MIKRKILKVIKIVTPTIYKKYKNYTKLKPHNKKLLKIIANKENVNYSKVGKALHDFVDNQIALKSEYYKIEYEREQLLLDKKTLIDNSFKKPGIYDHNITVSEACKVSKSKSEAEFIGNLAFILKSKKILELGTNVGISSAYLSLSINDNFGEVITLDASEYRQKIAKKIHKNLNINNSKFISGLFIDTLSKTLELNPNLELIFIDGHHQYKPTLEYFNLIYPYCHKNAVIILDDIRWSSDMKNAWHKLKNDKRVSQSIDLKRIGILILGKNSSTNEKNIFNIF